MAAFDLLINPVLSLVLRGMMVGRIAGTIARLRKMTFLNMTAALSGNSATATVLSALRQ